MPNGGTGAKKSATIGPEPNVTFGATSPVYWILAVPPSGSWTVMVWKAGPLANAKPQAPTIPTTAVAARSVFPKVRTIASIWVTVGNMGSKDEISLNPG